MSGGYHIRKSVIFISGVLCLLNTAGAGLAPELEEAHLEIDYAKRLIKMEDTEADHASLARWCELHGLDDHAEEHWRDVLAFDPDDVEAKEALEALARRREKTPERADAPRQGANDKPDAAPTPPSEFGRENLPWSEPDVAAEQEARAPPGRTRRPAHAPQGPQDSTDAMPDAPCLMWCGAPVVALVVLWVLRRLWRAWRKRREVRALTLAGVGVMEGHDFERYVACLMEARGYRTEVTPGSGDNKADIIAAKSGKRYAVEVKRYSSPVGPDVVAKVIGGRDYHRCDVAMVVTNSRFTKAAVNFAGKTGCILVGRKELAGWIRHFRK